MEKLIAFCGRSCTDCPAFLGVRRSTPEARAKLAAEWSTEASPLTPEDIDCHGCIGADDQLISFCRDCDIRACGIEKDVSTCAECGDYPCRKLEKVPPEAKAALEGVRGE